MREGQKRDVARRLRTNMTDAERKLWQCLRLKQVASYRFRRQHPIGPYIVDFACLEKHLVIEVDGGQHHECEADFHRDAFLGGRGFDVLRFWNNDVIENIEGVIEAVMARFSVTHPHPDLPPQAEEGDKPGLPASACKERP